MCVEGMLVVLMSSALVLMTLSMEANHLPDAQDSVTTFWEGDVVRTFPAFWTNRWSASKKSDLSHWKRFPSFVALHTQYQEQDSDTDGAAELASSQYIFMRWKEKFFITVDNESRVTIAGFYYVCFDRATGSVDGYYFDPLSSPYQRLRLTSLSTARTCTFTKLEFS